MQETWLILGFALLVFLQWCHLFMVMVEEVGLMLMQLFMGVVMLLEQWAVRVVMEIYTAKDTELTQQH